jgi:putative tricarboxylic transport membrane protein
VKIFFGFGAFGYILKMYGFQTGPVILGVILGPIMEDGYRRAMQDVLHSVPQFLLQFIVNPLTLALVVLTLVMVGGQADWWGKIKRALFKTKSVRTEKS